MYQKEFSEKEVVKSCNDKLEEDIIENNDEDQHGRKFAARGARSYMSRSDEGEDWDELSETQKKLYKEQIQKTLGKKKQRLPKGKMFTDQIIVSQTVSIHEDPDLGENFKEERQLPEPRQERWFNIMLVGGKGTGKTTFKECFLRQYKQKNNGEYIKNHTSEVYAEKVSPKMAEPNLQMTILDTPGYDLSDIENIYGKIKAEVENRMENFKIEEKKLLNESAIYQRQQRKVIDERVHCILFFLEGPRLCQADWWMLKKLQKISNDIIVPIIAKGDMYSLNQIREFKRLVKEKTVQMQIKWFDAEEYLRQHFPKELQSLKNGTYGQAPPFVIASSIMQVEDGKVLKAGRQFPWGTCIIEDPSHTDFKLLSRLLLRFFKDPLIRLTEIKTKSYMPQNHDSYNGMIKIIGAVGAFATLSLIAFKLPSILNVLKKD